MAAARLEIERLTRACNLLTPSGGLSNEKMCLGGLSTLVPDKYLFVRHFPHTKGGS